MPGIALFLQSESNDYQQMLRDDCLEATSRHRMPVKVFCAANDADRQSGQIRAVLTGSESERPNVMLVSPVEETSLPELATDAGRNGVGWVLLNRWSDCLEGLRNEYPSLPIFSVTPDQYKIGHVQGRQFRQLLPKGGEVVYVQGRPGTSSAQRRYEGLKAELSGSGIDVTPLDGDWSSEGGQRVVEEWLEDDAPASGPRSIIGAQNDSMAAGARRALAQAARRRRRVGVGRIHVTGCDGATSFGQRLVAEGKLTATVLVPPVAGRAVDEIASLLTGGPRPPSEIVLDVSSFPELTDPDQAEGAFGRSALDGREVVLLEGLQRGDPGAQAAVFCLYEGAVRRVLVRILRHSPDVADALQDTFVKVFRSAIQVKDPMALRSWVLRVAESVALDEFRRRQRVRARTCPDSEKWDVATTSPPIESRRALRDAYRVLSLLPEDEREVFSLRFIEGLELARIADACCVSLATVKRRLIKAEARFMSLARRQPGLSDWLPSA